MKQGKPSSTAQFVTLGRALANAGFSHVPGFSDPTARAFLNERGIKGYERTLPSLNRDKAAWRLKSARQMADMIALRTSAIDSAVRDAVAGGAQQLVILGAGYDGRAWRLPELAGVKVFEVDHPATQARKQQLLSELPPAMTTIEFVPMDFEKDSLDAVLRRAGHDRTMLTCWIWEGVVMYLTRDAMLATLGNVARLSARGSTLILNYHGPNRRWFSKIVFRLIGEPHISAWTTEEIAADLGSAGFKVREDSNMLDWNQRFANGEANVARAPYMRVAVAYKA